MNSIRCVAAVLLFALSSLLCPALATSYSTDQSDLWWIANESGWGIQFVHRGSIIFATIFVYDQNKSPTWYSATMVPQVAALTWSGDLIVTTGPWFGTVPFDTRIVTTAKAGTMTWTAQSVTAGVLTYNVGGVSVTKNLVRQPIALEDYSGHYGGGLHQNTTGCVNNSLNGIVDAVGNLNVSQNVDSVIVQNLPTTGSACVFAGTLTQAGQMGTVAGSYSCNGGDAGPFQLTEMQVNPTGVTGRFSATSTTQTGCQSTGWFGGIRVTTF